MAGSGLRAEIVTGLQNFPSVGIQLSGDQNYHCMGAHGRPRSSSQLGRRSGDKPNRLSMSGWASSLWIVTFGALPSELWSTVMFVG